MIKNYQRHHFQIVSWDMVFGMDRCDCCVCLFLCFVLQLFWLNFWILGCFIPCHHDIHIFIETWQRWVCQIAANDLSHINKIVSLPTQ